MTKLEQQILSWAIRQFSLTGYHGLSLSKFAEIADVPESSIFRIFSTKEDLFKVVLETVIARVENEVSSVEFALARAEDFNAGMRHGIRRAHECFTADFVRLRAIVFIENRALYPPFRHCIGLYERAFMRALERESVNGSVREDLDPRLTAHILVSHVMASKLFEDNSRTRPSTSTQISAFVEMLLRGIANQDRKTREPRKKSG